MMQPINKAELKHLVDNWRELGIVLNDVDTSLITDMSKLFELMTHFNEPIGNWNTENVTNMSSMFSEASSFNHPVECLDTRNVKNMSRMF